MTDRARLSSEALVPQGLPQGERQRLVAARQAAGVQNDPRVDQPQLPFAEQVATVGRLRDQGAARQVDPTLDVLLDYTPDDLPGFAQGQTPFATRGAPPPSLADRIDEIGATSNNRYMRAVAQRMRLRNR